MLKSIIKNVVKNAIRIEIDKRTNETQKVAIEFIGSIFKK